MNVFRRLISKLRGGDKGSGLPRTDAGAAERVRLNQAGESTRRVPAQQMMKKGGKVSSGYRKAADGCAVKGKTRGKMV
jgi:ribosomal protein L39E